MSRSVCWRLSPSAWCVVAPLCHPAAAACCLVLSPAYVSALLLLRVCCAVHMGPYSRFFDTCHVCVDACVCIYEGQCRLLALCMLFLPVSIPIASCLGYMCVYKKAPWVRVGACLSCVWDVDWRFVCLLDSLCVLVWLQQACGGTA